MTPGPVLFVVGKSLIGNDRWEFAGVFSTADKAVTACRDRTYFVAPAPLDFQPPENTETWPGLFWPHAQWFEQP